MAPSTVTLASGYEMPLVGFGLWKVGRETTAETVYNAIKVGYRLFDGAYDYQNEKEAGEGIRKAIADGLVKREDLFITTKLWNNYHKRENVLKMAQLQKETWGLDYFDLYLIHFPVSLKYIEPEVRQFPCWWMDDQGTIETEKVPMQETWQAMEEVVDAGIARSIGVSNFSGQLIYDVLNYARLPISVLQIEHHPFLVQPNLVALAQENKIAVTAYSSFGPQSFMELGDLFAKKMKGLTPPLQNEVVAEIAKAHGKTPAQVLLRWSTQRGIAVIPKSNNAERQAQNLDVTSFDLTKEEIDKISDLDIGLRFNDPGYYLTSNPLRIFA
ncbi:hypothetical protein TD95_002580 [Thielaviopsis punctulata]|uniref:NADP-dependent oxidoreductase domain-containing protein n=1 Tax=Thielaviopsis punctulata TaxID=72032 RepID=A0A0F4ZEV6_9PEZI|nr:hypothetical protein TD95_002580 [Thielaviopsis punctulata]